MASMLRKDEKLCRIPIIFLTARDSENDKLTGFNIGGDDYISKPFSIKEVQARVKAVLRRSAPPEEQEIKELTYESLTLDLRSKNAILQEKNRH